jgi:hypothetical protein
VISARFPGCFLARRLARRFSPDGERDRVPVRKAIAAAPYRVEAADPALARLLHGTVRTGAVCRYGPIPAAPVSWLLSPAGGTAAKPDPQRGRRSGREAKDALLAARRQREPGGARRLVVDPGPGRWPPDPQGLAVHFLLPEHGHLLVAAVSPGREPACRQAAVTFSSLARQMAADHGASRAGRARFPKR